MATDWDAQLRKLKSKKAEIEAKLDKLNKAQNGGESARVAEHFHLGMVGGSGRAVRALNKKKERELDTTIDRAKEIRRLHEDIDTVNLKIRRIESGVAQRDEAQRAELRETRRPKTKQTADHPAAIRRGLLSGVRDGIHTLTDGAVVDITKGGWDKEKREVYTIVSLTTARGNRRERRVNTIQRMPLVEAAMELAKEYLAGRGEDGSSKAEVV
jgi:hypothetical protein